MGEMLPAAGECFWRAFGSRLQCLHASCHSPGPVAGSGKAMPTQVWAFASALQVNFPFMQCEKGSPTDTNSTGSGSAIRACRMCDTWLGGA